MKNRFVLALVFIAVINCGIDLVDAKTAICYRSSGNDHWFIVNANIDCSKLKSTSTATLIDCWNFLAGPPPPPPDPNVIFNDPNAAELSPENQTLVVSSRLGSGQVNLSSVNVQVDETNLTGMTLIAASDHGVIATLHERRFTYGSCHVATFSYQDDQGGPVTVAFDFMLPLAQVHKAPALPLPAQVGLPLAIVFASFILFRTRRRFSGGGL